MHIYILEIKTTNKLQYIRISHVPTKLCTYIYMFMYLDTDDRKMYIHTYIYKEGE